MVCSVCGRKLKSPLSIEAGCGPVCYQKLHGVSLKRHKVSGEKTNAQKTGSICFDIPGQISIDDYLQVISAE